MLFFLLLHSITRCHAYATKASFSPGSRAKVNIIWPTATPFLCFKMRHTNKCSSCFLRAEGSIRDSFLSRYVYYSYPTPNILETSLLLNIKDLITATEIPNVKSWVSMGIFWGMLTAERRARVEQICFLLKAAFVIQNAVLTDPEDHLSMTQQQLLNVDHKDIYDISDTVPALRRRRLPQTASFAEVIVNVQVS